MCTLWLPEEAFEASLQACSTEASVPPRKTLQEFLLQNRRTPNSSGSLLPSSTSTYKVGDPVYALNFGPNRNKDGRWVAAVITKRKGTRTFNVRVYPRGPTWRRHIEQLQPRPTSRVDKVPANEPEVNAVPGQFAASESKEAAASPAATERKKTPAVAPRTRKTSTEHGPCQPRQTKRTHKQPTRRYSPSG